MRPRISSSFRPARTLLAAFAALAFASPSVGGAQTAGTGTLPAAPGSVAGIAYDSLRGLPVYEGIVQLVQESRVRKEAFLNDSGTFRFENIPGGTYFVRLLHNTLDTLGIAVRSQDFQVKDGSATRINVAIPSADRLIGEMCAKPLLARGPGAVVGLVRDPSTGDPVAGATIQLDASVKDVFGLTNIPSLRSATTDANGRFRICGLPEDSRGTLLVMRGGVTSGEVPVSVSFGSPLAIQGVGFALSNRIVSVPGDSGKAIRVLRGNASLAGKIVNDRGEPVEGARVTVVGTSLVTTTLPSGQFSMDSLPAGSQTVEIRKVGYGVTTRLVDVGPNRPVTMTMDRFVQTLPAMTTVESAHDKKLKEIGFADRRKSNVGGWLRSGEELHQHQLKMSDMLRQVPGLMISRVEGDGFEQKIEASNGGHKTCLNIILDRQPFKMFQHGDLDGHIQPDMIEAIEYYRPSTAPVEFFGAAGPTSCSVLVLWSRHVVPQKPRKDGGK